MPMTNQLAHNINIAAPKSPKRPTQSDPHQKERWTPTSRAHTRTAISLGESSGASARALEYYTTRRHLIILLRQHTAQYKTCCLLKQSEYFLSTSNITKWDRSINLWGSNTIWTPFLNSGGPWPGSYAYVYHCGVWCGVCVCVCSSVTTMYQTCAKHSKFQQGRFCETRN